MKTKTTRLDTLKKIITSQELGSQDEVLRALRAEGYAITQATLSRDMKLLKVVKTAKSDGRYVYVLPSETLYRRVHSPLSNHEAMRASGFLSIHFSGNIVVMKTRPGYASSLAYNIDNSDIPEILGTIAGDDTIFLVVAQGSDEATVKERLFGTSEI